MNRLPVSAAGAMPTECPVQHRLDLYARPVYSIAETGTIWTLSLALRYWRLVIKQHAIGLLGGNFAVQTGREFYPLTIGLRF